MSKDKIIPQVGDIWGQTGCTGHYEVRVDRVHGEYLTHSWVAWKGRLMADGSSIKEFIVEYRLAERDGKPYEEYKKYMEDKEKVRSDRFIAFLKSNKALTKFKRNLKGDIMDFINKKPVEDFFNEAFSWSDSPEGHEFWSDLNDLWYMIDYYE